MTRYCDKLSGKRFIETTALTTTVNSKERKTLDPCLKARIPIKAPFLSINASSSPFLFHLYQFPAIPSKYSKAQIPILRLKKKRQFFFS